jgi:hypothetical protein
MAIPSKEPANLLDLKTVAGHQELRSIQGEFSDTVELMQSRYDTEEAP